MILRFILFASFLASAQVTDPLLSRHAPSIQADPKIAKYTTAFPEDTSDAVEHFVSFNLKGISGAAKYGDVRWSIDGLEQALNTRNGRRVLANHRAEISNMIKQGIDAAGKNAWRMIAITPELINWPAMAPYEKICLNPELKQKNPQFCRQLEEAKENRSHDLALQQKTCGAAKDYSNQFPPVRNQNDIGWCFAFASADLLSFKMKTEVSASSVALSYYQHYAGTPEESFNEFKSSLPHGGTPADTIAVALKDGVCAEKDMPSEFLNGGLRQAYTEVQYLKERTEQSAKFSQAACSQAYQHIAATAFPNLNVHQFSQIFQKATDDHLVSELAAQNCNGKKLEAPANLGAAKLKSYPLANARDAFMDISANLDRGEPMAVAINADILYPQNSNHFLSVQANHAIIIAGKRWNSQTNACEFRIRNSWGGAESIKWMPAAEIVPYVREITSF